MTIAISLRSERNLGCKIHAAVEASEKSGKEWDAVRVWCNLKINSRNMGLLIHFANGFLHTFYSLLCKFNNCIL